MHVRRLQLTNFRTYPSLDLTLAPGRLLFLGDNAQGKSNLLEAVYLLASGRSARAGNDSELIGWGAEAEGQPFARLQADIARHDRPVQLETLIVGPPSNSARPEALEGPSGDSPPPQDYQLAAGASPSPKSERGPEGEVLPPQTYQHGASSPPFALAGRGPGGGVAPSQPGVRTGKRFRVNGSPRRAVDFVGQLRAVLFTADDLDIISGPPGARRTFLDAALSQLDRAYYAALGRYARIMQQRNATLRRIKESIAGLDELALWDDNFASEGAIIIAGRQNAVARLARLAAAAHAELAGDAHETLDLAYEPQLGDEWRRLLPAEPSLDAARSLFATALVSQHRRDTAAGVSLVGPHRDDVSVRLNGAPAAAFGSRAQIRTAALALRLAEARLLNDAADPPVLLLDDIVSELDERRRASVLEGVSGFDQVWFTATSGTALPPSFLATCQPYNVRLASITPA